jgi:hypothetical protein
MDIKQLKKDTARLPDIEEVTSTFEKHWLQPIRKNTNKELGFLQDLTGAEKKEFNRRHAALRKFLKEIKFGQVVNEKLESAAHNLVELKIASFAGDDGKIKRLKQTFLEDPHLRIKQLIFEVPYLESQISLFRDSYHSMLEQVSASMPLEQQVALLDGKHKDALMKLVGVSEEQKKCLKLIGKEFVGMMRDSI